jgi:Domain of unknown function (DUF4129)
VTSGSSPGIGRAQARELARRELARSIYRPSLLARWWHDILSWLDKLTSPTASGAPNWLAVALLAIVAAAALAAALYWLGPARASRRVRAEPVIAGRPRSAADYRHAAEQLAASENYQAAIAEVVRAIATELEERQVLPAKPARTADELAAEAALEFPAEAAELAAMARQFDEVRYGGRPGSQRGYARVQALDGRIRSAAPRPRTGLVSPGASR